jgi:hypothetical protein
MALPFLPVHEIPGVFQRLKLEANTDAFLQFADYISTNWVHRTTFTPRDWSVYGRPFERTMTLKVNMQL